MNDCGGIGGLFIGSRLIAFCCIELRKISRSGHAGTDTVTGPIENKGRGCSHGMDDGLGRHANLARELINISAYEG